MDTSNFLRFEEYNWVAIRKFFRSAGGDANAKVRTMKRFGFSTYIWNKAIQAGEIKLPKNWNCVRFNVGNHPSKGVGCDIRKMLVSPKGQKMSYAELGARFKCSNVNIVYHANALDLPHRQNKTQEEIDGMADWNKVQRYLDKTKNLTLTSRKFGISVGIINGRIRKGILTRPEGIGDRANRPGRGPDKTRRARRSV